MLDRPKQKIKTPPPKPKKTNFQIKDMFKSNISSRYSYNKNK